MKPTFAAVVALATSPALAVPPASFGFPEANNGTILDVAYRQANSSYVRVEPGILFGSQVPAQAPVLALNVSLYQSVMDYTGQYLAVMVDPDARYPEAPNLRFILHWLQPNLTLAALNDPDPGIQVIIPSTGGSMQLVNSTAPIAPYNRPMPPTNSSAHRYMFYLFEQPEGFSIPAAYSGYGSTNRTMFNLTGFIGAANLGTPAAANYFYASNESSVPAEFVAAAGGSYPNGNGQAVTSGDPATTAGPSSTGGTGTSPTPNVAAAMATGLGGLFGAGMFGLAALL